MSGASLVIDVASLGVSENVMLNGTGVGGHGALQLQAAPGDRAFWLGNVALASATSIGVTGANTTVLEVYGLISGAGSLTKVGSGNIDLNHGSANTYSGGTFINAGILFAGGTGKATGPGLVTVN